ncbi:MAG: hypothetical protein K6B28_06845 [Lachnospiraceae bacterium]|nr:hypothetical protein [Lachnospiraceae bacterium]
MNTKKIPLVVMLLGALVTCIVTYLNDYELNELLPALFLALVVFLIIGLIIKGVLDKFCPLPEEEVSETEGEEISLEGDEGEVIEKQVGENEGTSGPEGDEGV